MDVLAGGFPSTPRTQSRVFLLIKKFSIFKSFFFKRSVVVLQFSSHAGQTCHEFLWGRVTVWGASVTDTSRWTRCAPQSKPTWGSAACLPSEHLSVALASQSFGWFILVFQVHNRVS